jgi:methylated-DNA-[protein]-cysteine S-methyltransferase
VRTYGGLAKRVGRPGGARAVGQVMRSNPAPIVIPCHRVVAAGCRLGGFGGGRRIKTMLLELEGWRVQKGVLMRAGRPR